MGGYYQTIAKWKDDRIERKPSKTTNNDSYEKP